MEPKHIVYTDQTGRLPQPSTSGNNYMLIAYDHDSNCILLRAYKDKSAKVLISTMTDVYQTLTRAGCKPQFHRLDNECPQELETFFQQQRVPYQLTPPHDHRTNAAERAVRTAKNHLQAGWWSTDDAFPMYLWDKTLEHAELTLNLMRGSRINPALSAWEQIYGRYDFNKCPIAPPGVKVLAHEKTSQRASWSTHAFTAWYLGPALKHYRCHRVWATKSRQERIVNQLVWFPPKPFPKLTSEDLLRATIEDLKVLLLHPPSETYLGHMEQTQRGELIQLSNILHQHTTTSTDELKTKAPEGHDVPPLGVPPAPRRSPRQPQPRDMYTPNVALTAINPDTGKHAEYMELATSSTGERWQLGMAKELGRLFQGYQSTEQGHTVQGTNTCQFIAPQDIPPNKKATYIRIVAELREQKADPFRVRCTVGGNLINFPGDKSTKVAELVTIKCLINNIISTTNARAACIDVKDFYLNNELPTPEYVFFKADTIPESFLSQYAHKIVTTPDGRIYAKVLKGMYGLPQAGKVASDALLPRLKAAGYTPTGRIPGLFKHATKTVYFALVVDDFLVQYTQREDFEHLANTLRTHYGITTDMSAGKFCGITLQWDYTAGHVTLSMPGYVEKALQRFTHPTPSRPQHAPHRWIPPTYGASTQYAPEEDTTLPLDAKGIKRLQEVIGTFLFSARAVDNTMLVALSTLAAAQTKGTENTMNALMQLLDYAATHPNAAIRYHKSEMILYVHSDASYLSEPQARSRVGGYFYIGNHNEPTDNPKPNGPIHVESRILKHIMAAASEAEIAALFHTGQETVHIRNILQELGRPQLNPTQITTDNSTADGFANQRTKIRRSKAMDMRFYWVQDRVAQGQIAVRWGRGSTNHGDYFTKHHPPSHHTQVRATYLFTGCCVCVDCATHTH
jgi:Reverse transcriptase (RNA-dependent DNA polymerase)